MRAELTNSSDYDEISDDTIRFKYWQKVIFALIFVSYAFQCMACVIFVFWRVFWHVFCVLACVIRDIFVFWRVFWHVSFVTFLCFGRF